MPLAWAMPAPATLYALGGGVGVAWADPADEGPSRARAGALDEQPIFCLRNEL